MNSLPAQKSSDWKSCFLNLPFASFMFFYSLHVICIDGSIAGIKPAHKYTRGLELVTRKDAWVTRFHFTNLFKEFKILTQFVLNPQRMLRSSTGGPGVRHVICIYKWLLMIIVQFLIFVLSHVGILRFYSPKSEKHVAELMAEDLSENDFELRERS